MSSLAQTILEEPKSMKQHLFETKEQSDCTFIVGKENGQIVKGHKAILSAASPVLLNKLKAAEGDQPKVTLSDIEPEVFQSMLKYIYLDAVDFNSETVYDLAAAAKTYQTPGLLKACLDYIGANLKTQNVLRAYSLALHSSESDELKEKCEETMKTNTKAVLSDSSFEEACPDVVVAIFSMEYLDIDSELDLLYAADRYAKHIPKCDTADGDNLAVRKILKKIRFLSLTPEEFEKGRATTTVLPKSDACAILANVSYDKSEVPMPSGYSLRKDPRKKKNIIPIELFPLSTIKFKLRVPDIENFINNDEKAWSSTFKLQNLNWRVSMGTKNTDSIKRMAIFVYCNWESDSDTWSCKANVKIELASPDKENVCKGEFTKLFKKDNNWGFDSFIEVFKLLDPNNRYIEDGAITFIVRIEADEPQGL